MLNIQKSDKKTEQAGAALLALMHSRGPGIKLPTIEEMCAQFGVSRTALEPALLAVERRGLLRRRRGSGIYVTDRIRQKTIGIVFGGNIFQPGFSAYWSLLLKAVSAQADAFSICPQAYLDLPQGDGELGGHSQLFEDMDAGRLDGLLIYALPPRQEEIDALRSYGIPIVLPTGTPPDWVVKQDHEAFILLAARTIAELSGRRVGLLGPPVHRLPLETKLRQLDLIDIEIDDWSYETWSKKIPGAGSHENCAYRLTQRLISDISHRPLPDVLVCHEDTAARGVITALLQAGLQPGRDITIITSANSGSPVLDPYYDSVICITFDPAEEVCAALAMLLTLMDGVTPQCNPILIAPKISCRHETFEHVG